MKIKNYLKILLTAFIILPTIILAQGVAINDDDSEADPSAMLDVKSTDKGVLIPRMTEAVRDAINGGNPATGLMVYQTDNNPGFYYYDGNDWQTLINQLSTSPIIWSGGSLTDQAFTGQNFHNYRNDGVDFNTAASYLTADGNGTFTFIKAGYYRINFWCTSWLQVNNGSYTRVRFQKNGVDFINTVQNGIYNIFNSINHLWYFDAGDNLLVSVYGHLPSTVYFSWSSKRSGLQISHEGSAAPVQNLAPVATDVTFSSCMLLVSETLTGSYTYTDDEGDPEGISTYQWYRADDISGTNQAAISGATAITYVLQAADNGKHISFEVMPEAQSGTSSGTNVMSAYQGPTVSLSPGEVLNPETCKIWMDRNLGASQVATSSMDAAAYGDYYQWGRATEGHEGITSSTTSTIATTAAPNLGNSWDGKFITNSSYPSYWLTPQNDNLWQGVSGANNPCPSGFRLPTITEWEAERNSWATNDPAGAFGSPLKLTAGGFRIYNNGTLVSVGGDGDYWSSAVNGVDAGGIGFSDSFTSGIYYNRRANGFSVRCIKD